MAETTGIAWCDSTHNHWIGCTKVSVGPQGACVKCYAEKSTPVRTMKIGWGPGVPRHLTSAANRMKPRLWQRNAATFRAFHGRRQRVFCASLSDVFDSEVDPAWREDLWELIRETPDLDWLLLTKRIGWVPSMLPKDWGDGYQNVWLGITVVTQEEFLRDVVKLGRIRARIRFLSIEPQMEEIRLARWRRVPFDWVINGGESDQPGPGECRLYDVQWARVLVEECRELGVAFHMKQLGSKAVDCGMPIKYTGKGDDPSEWPEEIRLREFPA